MSLNVHDLSFSNGTQKDTFLCFFHANTMNGGGGGGWIFQVSLKKGPYKRLLFVTYALHSEFPTALCKKHLM